MACLRKGNVVFCSLEVKVLADHAHVAQVFGAQHARLLYMIRCKGSSNLCSRPPTGRQSLHTVASRLDRFTRDTRFRGPHLSSYHPLFTLEIGV